MVTLGPKHVGNAHVNKKKLRVFCGIMVHSRYIMIHGNRGHIGYDLY
jgi:hypothetical protein